MAGQGAWANVKPMPNRKQVLAFSPFLYKYHKLVERFFRGRHPDGRRSAPGSRAAGGRRIRRRTLARPAHWWAGRPRSAEQVPGPARTRSASPAVVTRAADHQKPELRRHHVEALRHVLADLVQGARAARIGGSVDIDEGLDPRQVGRQRPAIGAALEPRAAFLAGSASSAAKPAALTCSASSSPSRS